jgi:glutathione reductase (NADPH)
MEKFREIGIDVRTNTKVEAIERTAAAYKVHAKSPQGDTVIETDLVVHPQAGFPISIRSILLPAESPSRTDAFN